MMLFRTHTPDSTVWKRFRSGQDGFTFTRTGDIYEAQVVANAERVVDLFYTLSELMAPAVDVYIYDARSKTSWSGSMIALPDVRDAVARLKVPLSTYGGVEITLFTPEDQLTLSPQLELYIAVAASANVVGAAAVVSHSRWSVRALENMVALSAGFMVSVALLDLMPDAVVTHGVRAAPVILIGYLLVHLTQHTLAPHFHF